MITHEISVGEFLGTISATVKHNFGSFDFRTWNQSFDPAHGLPADDRANINVGLATTIDIQVLSTSNEIRAIGRYMFFTTNVGQATVFTVNPLTGNLQDTSTGYDVYLTNSNAVIAVTQAYDPVTAASNPVSYAGFKCVPDASKKITCNNANNLNALYNCGAYLYAVTPTYNFAQCRTGAVTFAAVDVTF